MSIRKTRRGRGRRESSQKERKRVHVIRIYRNMRTVHNWAFEVRFGSVPYMGLYDTTTTTTTGEIENNEGKRRWYSLLFVLTYLPEAAHSFATPLKCVRGTFAIGLENPYQTFVRFSKIRFESQR
ncbi:hypothetical protein FS842_010550 [Serendipita sp. 407]|nr:hypothetical protein FS842_010550 [Serendipita sp. 407]